MRDHVATLVHKTPHVLRPWSRSEQAQGISGFCDDVDEDYSWLEQNVFSKNPTVFPSDKYGPEDFRWAVGLALSRSFFVNGELRLTPLVDFANHASSRGMLEPTGKEWRGVNVFLCSSLKVLTHRTLNTFGIVSGTDLCYQ